MILRFLTLMALIVSLTVPALAKAVHAKRCASQTSLEMCYVPQLSGLASAQAGFELPCGAKALPCAKAALPSGAEREETMAFIEANLAWISQIFGPPEKPPRI